MNPITFATSSGQGADTQTKTEGFHSPVDGQPGPAPVREQDRNALPGSSLSPGTYAWIAGLPASVRPLNLARSYPRIANVLAGIWRNELECEQALNDLMLDSRGDRRGFSVAVVAELATLKAHLIDTATVVQYDIWGHRVGFKNNQ